MHIYRAVVAIAAVTVAMTLLSVVPPAPMYAKAPEQITIMPATFFSGTGVATGPIVVTNGTAAAPSLTDSTRTSGLYVRAAGAWAYATGTNPTVQFDSGGLKANSVILDVTNQDIQINRLSAGQLNITDVDGTPDFNINVSGAPALSTCGDGALATGSSNTSGRVTSATTMTACTLTFSVAYPANGADCVINNLVANRGNVTAASTTAFTVSNLTAGDDFMYHCFGR